MSSPRIQRPLVASLYLYEKVNFYGARKRFFGFFFLPAFMWYERQVGYFSTTQILNVTVIISAKRI
jgi:hypothetical protein